MKKLAFVLALLLAVQTWGVIGAQQAKRVTHTCKLEVGPLCYYWEKNTLGKIFDKDHGEEIEDALMEGREAAKEALEKLKQGSDP